MCPPGIASQFNWQSCGVCRLHLVGEVRIAAPKRLDRAVRADPQDGDQERKQDWAQRVDKKYESFRARNSLCLLETIILLHLSRPYGAH